MGGVEYVFKRSCYLCRKQALLGEKWREETMKQVRSGGGRGRRRS